jgi:hypothetical protein
MTGTSPRGMLDGPDFELADDQLKRFVGRLAAACSPPGDSAAFLC